MISLVNDIVFALQGKKAGEINETEYWRTGSYIEKELSVGFP